ncbi:hypothetical protein L1049_024354 [Liquidambar formosana]|uniref:Uncharacterized protein n=1 Tax=Liquidambar formosana TaxID=63359 RepID=A0AAP0RUB5_LIQFO
MFTTFNALAVSYVGLPSSDEMDGGGDVDSRTEPEHFTVPPKWVPFHTEVALRLYEAKKLFNMLEENVSGVSDWFRFKSAVMNSDVFALRSSFEVEGEWLNLLGVLHRRPVFPMGLLPPTEKQVLM